ncbi:MAG: hypothetical protein ACJ703_04245, partial [Nitrososphaera sp.]
MTLFFSSVTATRLTVTSIAIAVILIGSNFTLINAQQSNSLPQQQPPQQLANRPGQVQNGTVTATSATAFQSANDSFRIDVPRGWIINDLNNTGLVLSEEARRGYGILAQLCPEGQQQQLPQQRAAGANTSGSNTPNCQASENDVIHIIRYPNLSIRLFSNNSATNSSNMTTIPTPLSIDNVTAYHTQKLEEVGYHNITLVRNANMRVNLTTAADANQTITTIPAKFAQITYTTAIEPNETKTGYFIVTSTNATTPNATTTNGYAIFYEGNSNKGTAARPGIATSSGSSTQSQLSPVVAQILRSFELIVPPEIAQTLAQQAAVAESSQVTNATGTSAATTAGAAETTEDTTDGAGDGGGGDDDGAGDGGGGDDDGAGDGGGGDDDGAGDGGGGDDDG